ncbi:MAG: class I SAM-dependent methyltransferase [Acidobacteriia bacterium]|nr:class I SAM-dependent methyltransferase [Terriglobia bacterium]
MTKMESLEQVQSMGRERLYPSLTNPNWLVLRKRRELFRRWLEGLPELNLSVLDIGGRIQPYRPLMAGQERQYVAVDLRVTPLVDVVANAERLPLASESFDLVLCTQMLEYVPHPQQAILEIHRVLKPRGVLLLSVPTASLKDTDEDRWRFLPAGIRQLLSAFSEIELVAEGGSIAGLFRTVNVCLQLFARYRALRTVLSHTITPVLNLVGAGMEGLARSDNEAFAVNYSVLARK